MSATESQRARNRSFVEGYKQLHPCPCGETDISKLTFHHRDRSTKVDDIAHLVTKCSLSKLKKEVDKCNVICRKCHDDLERRVMLKRGILAKLKVLWSRFPDYSFAQLLNHVLDSVPMSQEYDLTDEQYKELLDKAIAASSPNKCDSEYAVTEEKEKIESC